MGAFVGVTTPQRSRMMAAIKGKGNKATELRFVQFLRNNGIKGWRRGSKIIGRPDVVFSKAKVAIFLDGCFWHGCPKCYKPPSINVSFWSEKVLKNRLRDKRTSRKLREMGWKVFRVWECKLGKEGPIKRRLEALLIGNHPIENPAKKVMRHT